jgi:single-strand DNA-binding protein
MIDDQKRPEDHPPEFADIAIWAEQAEALADQLPKGAEVYVEDRPEARSWTDQQQQIRSGFEVLANEVQFMTSRQPDGDDAPVRASGVSEQQAR